MKKKRRRIDVMAVTLLGLLLFLTAGSIIAGASGKTVHVTNIMIDADNEGNKTENNKSEEMALSLQAAMEKDMSLAVYTNTDASDQIERMDEIGDVNPDIVISVRCSVSQDAALTGLHVYCQPASSRKHTASMNLGEKVKNSLGLSSLEYLWYEEYGDNIYTTRRENIDNTTSEMETILPVMEINKPVIVVEWIGTDTNINVSGWQNSICKAVSEYITENQ